MSALTAISSYLKSYQDCIQDIYTSLPSIKYNPQTKSITVSSTDSQNSKIVNRTCNLLGALAIGKCASTLINDIPCGINWMVTDLTGYSLFTESCKTFNQLLGINSLAYLAPSTALIAPLFLTYRPKDSTKNSSQPTPLSANFSITDISKIALGAGGLALNYKYGSSSKILNVFTSFSILALSCKWLQKPSFL